MAVNLLHSSILISLLLSAILAGRGAKAGLLEPSSKAGPDDVTAVSEGILKFSKDFYLSVGVATENFVFSPLSVAAAIAIILVGLKGPTHDEVTATFHFPTSDLVLESGLKQIIQSLVIPPNSDAVTVNLTNIIFAQPDFPVVPAFVATVTNNFSAQIVPLNLSDPIAVNTINNLAVDATHNQITDLATPQLLANDPKLALLSALYFSAPWKQPFDPKKTTQQNFFWGPNTNDVVKVEMMHQTLELSVAFLALIDADVLALPYKGDRFVNYVFLPRTRNGLSKILQNLKNLPSISAINKLAIKVRANLALPKFQIPTTVNLKPVLEKLGINLLFNGQGDFSGTTPVATKGLAVFNVLQKAKITVNETGSEAGAATFVDGGALPTPARQIILSLTVDHPFLSMLVDTKNDNLLLFFGTVNNPALIQ